MSKKCYYLTVFLIVIVYCSPAGAQFSGGSGVEDDPWQVSNTDDLAGIRNYLDGHFIQTDDIDLTIELFEQTWIPIGDSDNPFTGTFDGGGYAIKNMTVYDPEVY